MEINSSPTMASVIIFLAAAIFLKGTLGELVCEKLGVEACAFAVASSGKRCSLETYPSKHGSVGFQCRSSDVMAGVNLQEHVETDGCINSCGVERGTVGISSDKLLEPEFSMKLCSEDCQFNCPNIVDLYRNLALAEGLYLPAMCKASAAAAGGSRRKMTQLRSSVATNSHVSKSSKPNIRIRKHIGAAKVKSAVASSEALIGAAKIKSAVASSEEALIGDAKIKSAVVASSEPLIGEASALVASSEPLMMSEFPEGSAEPPTPSPSLTLSYLRHQPRQL